MPFLPILSAMCLAGHQALPHSKTEELCLGRPAPDRTACHQWPAGHLHGAAGQALEAGQAAGGQAAGGLVTGHPAPACRVQAAQHAVAQAASTGDDGLG